MGQFVQNYIRPFVIPVVTVAVIWLLIMTVGETFLGVYQGGEKDRIDRPELWIGVGLILAILAVMGFLSTRPEGSLGPLDKDVSIGKQEFYGTQQLPKIDESVRTGQPGTVTDIAEGYTLYAQSGALARTLGMVPGGTDYGKRFAGFIYAEGLNGASKELWIPVEAVTSVYPDTRSAFLAIKGDETEAYGWTTPPESVTRGPSRHRDTVK